MTTLCTKQQQRVRGNRHRVWDSHIKIYYSKYTIFCMVPRYAPLRVSIAADTRRLFFLPFRIWATYAIIQARGQLRSCSDDDRTSMLKLSASGMKVIRSPYAINCQGLGKNLDILTKFWVENNKPRPPSTVVISTSRRIGAVAIQSIGGRQNRCNDMRKSGFLITSAFSD